MARSNWPTAGKKTISIAKNSVFKKCVQRLERGAVHISGGITVDDYDKYVTKYKAEMEDLDRKLVEYTNNDKTFELTSAYLLELASKAKRIFESSQPEQKNKILRMLLANPTLNEKRLQLPLLKPFSVLIDTLKTQNWLALANTLRTESSEYDERQIGMIKEVLHSH